MLMLVIASIELFHGQAHFIDLETIEAFTEATYEEAESNGKVERLKKTVVHVTHT